MSSDIRERFLEIERRLRSRLFVSIGLLLVLIAPPIYSLAPLMNEHLEIKSMQRHRERAERISGLVAAASKESLAPIGMIQKLFYSSLLSQHGSLLVLKDGAVETVLPESPQSLPAPPLGGKYILPEAETLGVAGAKLYQSDLRLPQGHYELVFLSRSIPYSAADRLARLDVLSLALAFGIGLILVFWSYRGSLRLARSQHELALSLAHEIRTPLASMRLYSEMLSDGVAVGEEQRQRFQNLVAAQTEKLSQVVDRLLAANTERSLGEIEVLTVTHLIEALREELELFLAPINVKLEIDADDARNLACRCDVAALKQIFLIFADNAVKHSVSDEFRTLRLGAHGLRRLWRKSVVLSLRDFGSKKRVTSKLRAPQGLGLGLRIASRLAASMGAATKLRRRSPGREAQLVLKAL